MRKGGSESVKWARIVMVAVGVITLVFGVGAAFEPGGDPDGSVLIATFGAGMGLFAIALALRSTVDAEKTGPNAREAARTSGFSGPDDGDGGN